MRALVLIFSLTAVALAQRQQLPPSVSVRPTDSKQIHGTVNGLLGWRVGVAADDLKQTTFSDAAGKADSLGFGFIEGSAKSLDYNLSAEELAKVRHRLAELRMGMPVYSLDSLPADDAARRKLFDFAKSLGVETIVAGGKITPEFGAAQIVNMGTPGKRATQQLLEMVKQMPPPQEFPDKCSNCGRPTGPLKPVFIRLDPSPAAIQAFEKAARPAMGYRVEQITKILPITSVDKVPADERQKIEAGLPKQALAKPKKARKLLVIDLSPAGGYYHTTVAHANLALQLMARYTDAFQPIFSNDLNNLKWPKIKQYDAVFLNSVVGELFPDPEVMSGLLRFVREGGGLAGVHGSTYASFDVPEFGDLIGAQDGPHRVEKAILRVEDKTSPMMKGFGGKQDFEYTDEFYHFLPSGPYSREKLHVLLSINLEKSPPSPFNDTRPDHDYGLAWVKSYGKGRVFNTVLGHTPTLFATPALAEMMLGGIQFALGDLDADTTPSAKLAKK
jgi:type 1 glutamine amidotransferase